MKKVIRLYPTRKKEYEQLHEQSITANLSGMPGGGGVSRSVEGIALRELPYNKQREYDAVNKALEVTRKLPNGDQRIKIIDLVYWKRSHTLDGAGYKVGYASTTTRQINAEFVRLVGKLYGYELQE